MRVEPPAVAEKSAKEKRIYRWAGCLPMTFISGPLRVDFSVNTRIFKMRFSVYESPSLGLFLSLNIMIQLAVVAEIILLKVYHFTLKLVKIQILGKMP